MSSQDLTIFKFDSNEIRVTDQNGEHWFVLRDLLVAMKSATKVTDAVESIKQGLGDGFANDVPILDSLGREQPAIIVRESAATYLLSRSNTDRGRELNRFIHVEVLPSIRKTGSFQSEATKPKAKRERAGHSAREAKAFLKTSIEVGAMLGTEPAMARAIAVDLTLEYTGVD